MTDPEWDAECTELRAAFQRFRSLPTAPPTTPPPSRHPEHFPLLTYVGSLVDDEEPDERPREAEDYGFMRPRPDWRDPLLADTTTKETDEHD